MMETLGKILSIAKEREAIFNWRITQNAEGNIEIETLMFTNQDIVTLLNFVKESNKSCFLCSFNNRVILVIID